MPNGWRLREARRHAGRKPQRAAATTRQRERVTRACAVPSQGHFTEILLANARRRCFPGSGSLGGDLGEPVCASSLAISCGLPTPTLQRHRRADQRDAVFLGELEVDEEGRIDTPRPRALCAFTGVLSGRVKCRVSNASLNSR